MFYPLQAIQFLCHCNRRVVIHDTIGHGCVPMQFCCRKGDPFQGLKVGSCLTPGNELSEEIHMQTEQEILLERGTQVESRRVREPRRAALPLWLEVSGFMVMGLVSRLSLASHSDWVFPGGAHLVQPRWMPARRIQGGGWTHGVIFWPLLNSPSSWWLISSLFLTRTSCHKTTHANGYYRAWPQLVGTRTIGPKRIKPILNHPLPMTLRQLRGFWGITGYCCIWILGYGEIARLLYKLITETQQAQTNKAGLVSRYSKGF